MIGTTRHALLALPECHGCARRDAQFERLLAFVDWFRNELASRDREYAAVVRARDDARDERDREAERADRLLEQRDAAVRTRNAVADSVAKLKAAHRAELDTLQARLTVAAQEIERLRAIPDLTDEERAAFLAASNPEVPHVGA